MCAQLLPSFQPVLVNSFHDRDDLIAALLTSSHIPFWFDGGLYTMFRHAHAGAAVAVSRINLPFEMRQPSPPACLRLPEQGPASSGRRRDAVLAQPS